MLTFLRIARMGGRLGVAAAVAALLNGAATASLLALVGRSVTLGSFGHDAALRLLVMAAAVVATSFVSTFAIGVLGARAVTRTRLALADRILAASVRRVEDVGPHRLRSALTHDANVIGQALQNVPEAFSSVAFVLATLGYLAWLSPALLGVFLAVPLLGGAIFKLIIDRTQAHDRGARRLLDTLHEGFDVLVEGTKELKMNRARRDAWHRDDFLDVAAKHHASAVHVARWTSVGMTWTRSLAFIAIVTLVTLGPRVPGVTAHTLGAFVLGSLFMLNPLMQIVALVPHVGRARVAFDSVDELDASLAGDEDGTVAPDPARTIVQPRTVTLTQVTHVYRDTGRGREFVLGPVDLRLEPGEIVFLVGGNGSGKSTLARLVTGIYAPDAGTIALDGVPITAADRDAYRQHFAAVFSDAFVFERIHGVPPQGLAERAQRYLAAFGLAHKVTLEGTRFSTTALSSGQRKRLALLIAYLEDRPIYVLDEWASEQDPTFKRVFYTELLPELKRQGRTVLAITHDDGYLHVADRVVTMQDGRIVDSSRPVSPSPRIEVA